MDAEHPVDGGVGSADDLLLRGDAEHVRAATCGRSAAELLHEMKRARHAGRGRIERGDPLLEARGGIAALSEAPRGLPHAVAREARRLEENFTRVVFDLAVEPSHDPREGDRTLAVADEKIPGLKGEFLLVESRDLLSLPGAADDDPVPLQKSPVERVHGLTHFEQHIVRDVHDVVHRAQPHERETAAQEAGALPDLHVLDEVPHVARAELGLLDLNRDLDVRLCAPV